MPAKRPLEPKIKKLEFKKPQVREAIRRNINDVSQIPALKEEILRFKKEANKFKTADSAVKAGFSLECLILTGKYSGLALSQVYGHHTVARALIQLRKLQLLGK